MTTLWFTPFACAFLSGEHGTDWQLEPPPPPKPPETPNLSHLLLEELE